MASLQTAYRRLRFVLRAQRSRCIDGCFEPAQPRSRQTVARARVRQPRSRKTSAAAGIRRSRAGPESRRRRPAAASDNAGRREPWPWRLVSPPPRSQSRRAVAPGQSARRIEQIKCGERASRRSISYSAPGPSASARLHPSRATARPRRSLGEGGHPQRLPALVLRHSLRTTLSLSKGRSFARAADSRQRAADFGTAHGFIAARPPG